jgi:hypothetical protein
MSRSYARGKRQCIDRLKEQDSKIEKVNAQLEMSKPALRVVDNR